MDLFSVGEEAEPEKDVFPDIPDCQAKVRLAMEKESAGIYLTGHPLAEYAPLIRRMNAAEAGVIKRVGRELFKG